jgi:hypothetical protein
VKHKAQVPAVFSWNFFRAKILFGAILASFGPVFDVPDLGLLQFLAPDAKPR